MQKLTEWANLLLDRYPGRSLLGTFIAGAVVDRWGLDVIVWAVRKVL